MEAKYIASFSCVKSCDCTVLSVRKVYLIDDKSVMCLCSLKHLNYERLYIPSFHSTSRKRDSELESASLVPSLNIETKTVNIQHLCKLNLTNRVDSVLNFNELKEQN
nr:hypothetical protein Iba_chr10aCG2170 [Ipomoea batatas]GMD47869.1 hypothetical protein Iba_chr10fCG0930 [Ipomoea batatas]